MNNEIKQLIKRVAVTFFLVLISYLFQTGLFPQFALNNAVPNFLIIITASYGFMRGSNIGMLIGFICGILLDFRSPEIFGVFTMAYIFLGYLNGLFRKLFYGEDLRLPLALISVSEFLYGMYLYLISYIKYKADFYTFFKNIVMPQFVYTALVSIVFYYLILKLFQMIDESFTRRGIQ